MMAAMVAGMLVVAEVVLVKQEVYLLLALLVVMAVMAGRGLVTTPIMLAEVEAGLQDWAVLAAVLTESKEMEIRL